jgi:cytoskeletal protein CcmA (bactofilin family)
MMGIMWKSGQNAAAASKATPEEFRPVPPAPTNEPAPLIHAVPARADSASIGDGLVFKGTITGTGSLYIDGELLGNIDLPESCVTVGPNGHVSDGLSICITAREIVVMGKIRGNISATDRVEIHAEGSLTGNVSAHRISIADGAFFKGDINLRSSEPGTSRPEISETSRQVYA